MRDRVRSPSSPGFRRAFPLLLGGVYLVPSLLGILLQVAHGLEHALTSSMAPAAPVGAVVHSHDGSTHSHGPAVAVLAAAVAEDAQEDEAGDPEAVPPLVLLAMHTVPGLAVLPPGEGRATPAHGRASMPPVYRGAPPVPPPRA